MAEERCQTVQSEYIGLYRISKNTFLKMEMNSNKWNWSRLDLT